MFFFKMYQIIIAPTCENSVTLRCKIFHKFYANYGAKKEQREKIKVFFNIMLST